MIEIDNFQQLIHHMRPMEQSFIVKYENWKESSQDHTIFQLFKENTISESELILEINNYDIFRESDLKKKVLLTLFWGYPTRGRGNNINRLLEKANFENLLNTLEQYTTCAPIVQDLKKDAGKIKGLGIATMTKFIYFLNVEIESYKALILDQRVVDCYNNNRFDALRVEGTITNQNCWKFYAEYLKQMNNLAKRFHTKEDQLEAFVFMFGNNLKSAQ